MARPLRVLVENGFYHLTARGIAKQPIYADDIDRRRFLRGVERSVSRLDWRCLAYCLMENHFHLIVRTPVPNLARGMQQVNSQFAQYYNKRHNRIGPLFAGRYGAKLIQRDAHLLEVFRYVALNPVRSGACDDPEDWIWGSHGAIAGTRAGPDWLGVDEVHALFADAFGGNGRAAYVQFVLEGTAADVMPDAAALGDEAFLKDVLPSSRPGSEFVERDWGPGRPPLTELLKDGGSGESIALAYRDHGYTMSHIAAALGCHVCTVSRRLAAHEGRMLECKT